MKNIIFDFDGTIADTSPGIFNSIRYASKKMDLRVLSIDELKRHLGPPMHKAYGDSFGISGLELERAIDLHKEYSMSAGYKEFEFYPGMLEVLKELKNRNFKMGIATTKSDVVINKIFQENKLDRFFETVNGAMGQETKSDIVRRCLYRFQDSDDYDTLIIGDSVYDQDAAVAINADFIGVTYGYGFSEKDANTLDKPADSPKKILNYLL